MKTTSATFLKPTTIERMLNRFVGVLVGWGIGPGHACLLEVKGRKSGRLYSTPVDLLETGGKSYLVCPRGRAQWVRNAEAAGYVTLRRGSSRRDFSLRALADSEKPPLLKEYLDRFKVAVQRYFPVEAGSPESAFAAHAQRYPVFELMAADERK